MSDPWDLPEGQTQSCDACYAEAHHGHSCGRRNVRMKRFGWLRMYTDGSVEFLDERPKRYSMAIDFPCYVRKEPE